MPKITIGGGNKEGADELELCNGWKKWAVILAHSGNKYILSGERIFSVDPQVFPQVKINYLEVQVKSSTNPKSISMSDSREKQ